ncbi:bifunctional tRNA (5-methylaminomethyl-2-thiouridine)(34)-methyltransferase MnmD/FAD-dependent 5-carboxymethylaminomethyl-2-thiouridine(34) oxidoreductase MnmC [Thalassotalea sp. PLHSN55]|uniref:bifunctional tRNA (5-methylaminomethyl-2-thiouridine)(34)-methyltransferase MnmD/FAD-dependent 5-carboxymethylaminomethyl-2-thiouridine(34) oxidoreductase MnmC n=1 Tax=Thalassotalea sp. PLHSN55 TaxID=3435888 RepID=UPI003F873859
MADQTPIIFQADGSPFSQQFNDIYFDSHSGYAQSESVFIKGNKLKQRLEKLSPNDNLTIAETGFGSGLNFLLTLKVYLEVFTEKPTQQWPSLCFISTEKFPMSKVDLAKSLEVLPELARLARLLISEYPKSCDENNSLHFFEQKVTLRLLFDDSTQALSQLKVGKQGLVDVWFLDGFSPARNPEMWSLPLFEQIARLSKPQASLSTFTVAGFVKRQLQQVGFRVERKGADGKKKEMTCGLYQAPKQSGKGYQQRPLITKPQHVSIIGGGIASACAAYVLTQKGIKVTLYCKDFSVAQGASSNAIGALYPLLHQKADDISLFYEQAFWRAKQLYQSLDEQGFNYAHQWCGLLDIAYKEAIGKRHQQFSELNTWPHNLIHQISAEQASKVANISLNHGGLFMPHAGWIAPQELVKALFSGAEKTGRLRIETGIKIKSVTQVSKKANVRDAWQLHTDKGDFLASVLILAGGAESIPFDYINELPLTSVRGQVTSMKTNDDIGKLNTVICHKGYLTPQYQNQHCIGATFEKNSFDTNATKADDEFNLTMLNKCLPDLVSWDENDISRAKARLRCMTPDHLPMVGAMPDIEAHKAMYPHLAKDKNWRYHEQAPVINNLYVMTGFGARGFCSAPLAADILAADLCGTPYPVDNNMLFNLAPNRFIVRDIIRRKFE